MSTLIKILHLNELAIYIVGMKKKKTPPKQVIKLNKKGCENAIAAFDINQLIVIYFETNEK